MPQVDVAIVGGGPGGSSAGAFLARRGISVALFEREAFPRFHVGESLMPAAMLVLEQMGARRAIDEGGFQLKYGACFIDEEHGGAAQTFYFLPGQPWPNYTYQVPRAEFDTRLLEHARKCGVTVYQPAEVESAAFDADGVTVTARADGETMVVRAAVLVDASGRDGFVASRYGERRRIPNLGKVALFAHFRGARRAAGLEEGNIRIYAFKDGWCWWIPLANDLTSVGVVCHARTVRQWPGDMDGLYVSMLGRSRGVSENLPGAVRATPVHTTANFAYHNSPVIADRFLAVGDAIAFVDPIFSGGVYIALRTGQLAADAIAGALAAGDFRRRRFVGYERRVRAGLDPLFKFIHKYYEPAFFHLFMHPRDSLGMYAGVLNVLSGGNWIRMPWRVRLSLRLLFGIARVETWMRRRRGLPVESRLEW
jgi:flavin-dependent dehydrogenase